MTHWKAIFILWFIVSLLPPSPANSQPQDMDKIEIARMDMGRALLDKYSFMAQPYSFYYFHNMDKIGLGLDWVHRNGEIFLLKEPGENFAISYGFAGKHYSLEDYYKRNFVLGFLVLHNEQIILEKYYHGADSQSRFISNSVVKSFISVLIGIAVKEGKIKDIGDPVVRYLPYLANSGFKEATIKDLLKMSSGVRWDEEDYLGPGCDFNRYMSAWLRGETSLKDLAASCTTEEKPGERFEYKSIDTEVLGRVLEAATGMPLNKYLEKKLWDKIGAQSDAFFYRGKMQPNVPAAVGFNATLRDYGRFGLMVMNKGRLGSQRCVDEAWIEDSTAPEGISWQPQSAGPNDEFSDNMGYGYQWWLIPGDEHVFMALGIYGQAIYVNPKRQIVIVQSSAWPNPDSQANWDEMIKVMETIARKVSPSEVYAENFTQTIWDENYGFYQKILGLPFNQKLSDGSLDEKIFKNYIIQDYIFLQNFKKVYGILLSKAPDRKGSAFIADLIKGIDEEIETVHMKYFRKFGVTKKELTGALPNPGTELYNSYLVKTAALEPFQVGLIATLPCNWIYYQVGVDMKKKGQAGGNKYQEWIDAYGSETWEESDAKAFVDLVESYMKNSTPADREKMRQAYESAMKLEYMFWDEAYRQPISK